MSTKTFNLFSKICVIIFVLGVAFVLYNFFNFYQLKSKCLNKVTNQDIEASLIFDKTTSSTNLEFLSQKLSKITGIKNISIKSPEQVKADFIERRKNNHLIIESLENVRENPFMPAIVIHFNISNGGTVATEVKRTLKEGEIETKTTQFQKTNLDSEIASRKTSLDTISKIGFFDYRPITIFQYGRGKTLLELCLRNS